MNKEPIQERNKVMMGMLASIGIEKGKPFACTTRTQGSEAWKGGDMT